MISDVSTVGARGASIADMSLILTSWRALSSGGPAKFHVYAVAGTAPGRASWQGCASPGYECGRAKVAGDVTVIGVGTEVPVDLLDLTGDLNDDPIEETDPFCEPSVWKEETLRRFFSETSWRRRLGLFPCKSGNESAVSSPAKRPGVEPLGPANGEGGRECEPELR